MSILLEIPGTILKMTEYKISGESVAYDLSASAEGFKDWIDGLFEFRHDALLRIVESNIDVMVMEAKPGVGGSERDIEKLGAVLTNILYGMKTRFPVIPSNKLQVHGIMFTGYRVQLLEARFRDNHSVVFSVSEVNIPHEQGSIDDLMKALQMFIAFKRRVQETIETLRDAET